LLAIANSNHFLQLKKLEILEPRRCRNTPARYSLSSETAIDLKISKVELTLAGNPHKVIHTKSISFNQKFVIFESVSTFRYLIVVEHKKASV
jgi:hypothetical protein